LNQQRPGSFAHAFRGKPMIKNLLFHFIGHAFTIVLNPNDCLLSG
jgi:hypothetical protein